MKADTASSDYWNPIVIAMRHPITTFTAAIISAGNGYVRDTMALVTNDATVVDIRRPSDIPLALDTDVLASHGHFHEWPVAVWAGVGQCSLVTLGARAGPEQVAAI